MTQANGLPVLVERWVQTQISKPDAWDTLDDLEERIAAITKETPEAVSQRLGRDNKSRIDNERRRKGRA